MSETARVPAPTVDFFKATRNLTLKHWLAVYRLDLLGYAPVYRTKKGTFRVLGRTLAYQAMNEEGFTWYDELEDWFIYPPL